MDKPSPEPTPGFIQSGVKTPLVYQLEAIFLTLAPDLDIKPIEKALRKLIKEAIAEEEKEQAEYPRDWFHALIQHNSPYAPYIFQWIPYQAELKQWRLKMLHDVKTFDGREEHGIWPNGSSCGSFKDEEVEYIRISREQFGGKWEDPRDKKG